MECDCYLRNIHDLLSDGKTPYERRFGMPFNGPVIPFGAMVEHHQISAKDLSRVHQFGPKILPGMFLGHVLYAGRKWKRDIMIADIEELEEMDASEIHARRLNAKEVLTPMERVNFIFSVADGTVKNPGRDRRLRPYTWIRDRPERGEDQEVFRGESDGLFSPNPFQDDSTRDDAEAQNDFCLLREISFIVITWNPWSNCTCRKRRIISYSDEVHRRYQNNTYITGRIVRKTDWWLLERRWRKRIIWCMDRHHKIPHFERKATWRIFMVGVEDWRRNKQPQDPIMYGRVCGSISLMQRKAKRNKNWAVEKPKLDHARQLRGILFVEPDDAEFRHIIKNARRKLEVPMPAAMPCKTPTTCRGETCRSIEKKKNADETMRVRLEGVPHRHHEDHISAKRNKFSEPLQFGT